MLYFSPFYGFDMYGVTLSDLRFGWVTQHFGWVFCMEDHLDSLDICFVLFQRFENQPVQSIPLTWIVSAYEQTTKFKNCQCTDYITKHQRGII